MNTHEATLAYAEPVLAESTRLCLELSAAIPNSHGAAHEDMIKHFGMRESREIPGLASLRATTDVDAFLAFFGGNWGEALERWPTLAFFHAYRQEHGPEAYTDVEAWQLFYGLLARGVHPIEIKVAFIEHY